MDRLMLLIGCGFVQNVREIIYIEFITPATVKLTFFWIATHRPYYSSKKFVKRNTLPLTKHDAEVTAAKCTVFQHLWFASKSASVFHVRFNPPPTLHVIITCYSLQWSSPRPTAINTQSAVRATQTPVAYTDREISRLYDSVQCYRLVSLVYHSTEWCNLILNAKSFTYF